MTSLRAMALFYLIRNFEYAYATTGRGGFISLISSRMR